MICPVCNTNKVTRGKYCSPKCKQKAFRNAKRNETVTPKAKNVTETPKRNVTTTDQLFEQERPGYYKFGVDVIKKKCFECNKAFETRLELLKTCSPEHQQQLLNRITV